MTQPPARIVGTKSGAIAAAIYTSILAAFGTLWYFMRYVIRDLQQEEYRIMGYAAFAVYGSVLLTSALLLTGIKKNSKRLFSPWLIIMIMVLLFDTGSISLLTALHLDSQQSLTMLDSVGIVWYCFRMVTHIFSMICVQLYSRQLSIPKCESQQDDPPSYVSTIQDALHQPPPPYTPLDCHEHNPPSYTEAVLNQSYCEVQIPLETIERDDTTDHENNAAQNHIEIPGDNSHQHWRTDTEAEPTATNLPVQDPLYGTFCDAQDNYEEMQYHQASRINIQNVTEQTQA